MYLKGIRASGFKSFADKIDLELNDGITAIVGPNGSGKSNIVDAIRWVMGEQSVKSLRGQDNMSDVIFSGSSSREAQKRASVSLIFDNKDHFLNSDFEEIEIKRMVYATGENEYFINNTRVRLKDITNLFIDSGAGVGAFNIISQGNITDIVNSKPNERRIIFESAAGVLKYKKRKEEAIRKLDKTKDNLNAIKLVVDELSKTVIPLKKQSEDAKKYLDYKNELESVEIALIANDITNINKRYEQVKIQITSLEENLLNLNNNEDSSHIEKLKLENLKIDERISKINSLLIDINEELSKIASEKQITLERQKYSVDMSSVSSNLIKSKEEELELEKNFNIIDSEVKDLIAKKQIKERELSDLGDDLLKLKIKRSSVSASVDEKNKNLFYLQNKIDIAKENVLNNNMLPSSVKNVVNNHRLTGVHNTIGNLIDIPYEYELAINTILGASSNFVVVDNFESAKRCIEFLKQENLGRATFFPLDTIKSRYISEDILEKLEKEKGFVGIASSLIQFDKIYKNIIENQLGNVIVVDSLDNLDLISKKYDYKYRCVSLNGEIMHVGGSITGGNLSNNYTKSSKQVLKNLEREYENLELTINALVKEQTRVNDEFFTKLEQEEILNKEIIVLKEMLNTKELAQKTLQISLNEKKSEIAGSKNIINNKLDEELIRILEAFTKKSEEKTLYENELKGLKAKRDELNSKISELELIYKENNSKYNKVQNELKELEIEKGRLDVKLDNLLINLSENYNLTYEAAEAKYSLDLEIDIAREKVKTIKRDLDNLGNVNLGSIEEYERLSKRYEFLESQKNDLETASDELLSIICEMDDIMVSKFKSSFESISKEFKEVFRTIFQGGKGELKLTNPSDLLSSGIEIVAIPPGKKINSTVALSGGEQSLTAICLLFSILNVRPVPFIILDEAEAALDEANVDMFGKYISNKKKESQFILITHKKRMMEYADTLYGITMQESGVSKIVSAKLED